MSTDKLPVIVIDKTTIEDFQEACQALIKSGYKVSSTCCGVLSPDYSEARYYIAILAYCGRPTKPIQLTPNSPVRLAPRAARIANSQSLLSY